ncbi:MAG TPA: serine hydrolase domain-containing protein [Vicinamibacteria bacterium]|nr:serine hydrolase domain-containing protein [Vicinamibacteria bacterium]
MNRSRTLRATCAGAIGVAILLLAMVSAFAQPAPADYTDDTALPAGRRGERIRQVLDAVNLGDRARIEALVKDAFGGPFREIPLEDHLGALGGLHDSSRGLDFYGVRRYADGGPPDRVVVIARNRLTQGWQGLSLTFDGTPEERITGLQIQPARPPKGIPPLPPLTAEQAKAELGAFLDRLAEAGAFSGTALLAKDGQVVFEGARGIADRNHGVPMRLDSKLNLGSMNKMFTAVVIGQLVDEGTLSFQDPVSKFLGGKGWTKADLSKVRVEHLLSHTSGLGSYFNDTYQRMARQLLRKVDDYKPLVAEETLAFEPGTRWQYSNTGFLLAGAVIEAVTGQDYFDVVRERVYAKAGMPTSDSYDIDLVVPNLAIGYSRERTAIGTRWRANTFEHVIRGGPAGGGYSTARDLLAFAEAMRKGKLVSATTARLLWSAKPELRSPDYGYGFGVGTDSLGPRVGHSGGFSGIASVLDIYLDSEWTLVVLSNVDGGMPPVAQKLRETAGRIR